MKSWKTTIAGAIGAAIAAAIPLIQTGTIELKDIAIAATLAFIGFFAKDSNVTGGTKKQ